MDIEFHYHITYILASEAGFGPQEAGVIAYASQYVDDNTRQYTVKSKETTDEYQNFISQTLDITKPRNRLIRIHPCFHFMPGDFAKQHARVKRRDGLLHVLNTTPDSGNANRLMDAALRSGNLYRLGIATHCYADSWAHQNFVGYRHSFNGFKGLFVSQSPASGMRTFSINPIFPTSFGGMKDWRARIAKCEIRKGSFKPPGRYLRSSADAQTEKSVTTRSDKDGEGLDAS